MPTGSVITVKKSGGDYSSISAAAAKAKPGDTVLISAGTYAETLDPPNSGTANAPITFMGVPGQKVIIDGGGSRESGNGLVSFSNLSNIMMVNITVANSGSHGIFSQGAKNIVIRDCGVQNSLDGGIVFLESSNVKVQRCDVTGNNARGTSASNEAISLDHTDGFEVSFNKVHKNGEEGIDAKYDSSAGKIFNNMVDANRGPNIYVDSANGVEVFNNVVTNTTEESKAGISVAVESLSDTKKAANISIYNNVVKGNAGGGIGFWIESGGTFSNISIMNNTVVGNDKAGLNIDGGSFAGTNILRNNIFNGNSGGSGSSSNFQADHNIGIGSALGGVLKFVAGSLALDPGSAGIGQGSTTGAPDFDLNGVARNGKIDIGAYQLGPLPVAVDVPAVASQVTGQLNDVLGSISASVTTAVLGSGQRAPSDVQATPAPPTPSATEPTTAPSPAPTTTAPTPVG
jgi:parallel beta-helix repeat protein